MTSHQNEQKLTKSQQEYFCVSNFSSHTKNQLLKPNRNVRELQNDLLEIKIQNRTNHLSSLLNQFKFSNDVIAERCVHLLPYDEKFYNSVYKFKRPLIKKVYSKLFKANPGVPQKHTCHFDVKDISFPELAPIEKFKKKRDSLTKDKSTRTSPVYVKKYWDEYLLSLMSKNTSQYLTYDLTTDATQATRLKKLVESWYGPPSPFRELVPDDETDTNDPSVKVDMKSQNPYKYFMDIVKTVECSTEKERPLDCEMDSSQKKIQDLLTKEINFHSDRDSESQVSKTTINPLPVIKRKEQKKINQDIEIEKINKTTKTLKEFQLPKTPPKLVNHKIGNKVLKTDNQFQKEIFIDENKQQKKLLKFPDDIIDIDDKIYRKRLQPIWPSVISSDSPSEEQLNSKQPLIDRVVKGHNRWTELPVQEQNDLLSVDNRRNSENLENEQNKTQLYNYPTVNLLVDQWRKKWQLCQKHTDITINELLTDMLDIHPTIRMQAIITSAKAASVIYNDKNGHMNSTIETINSDTLPPVLIEAINILLDDPHFQVRKVAAIAFHSLKMSSEKSLEILERLLHSDSNVDRWIAAQCLTLANKYDNHIISELIEQLINSEDNLILEKASRLLTKISGQTKLVHGMLGERLNTMSWIQRVIICKTLPQLQGSLNKDLLKKLIYLMWHDPHKQVRTSASLVLGKTGNGKAVHDELITKLQDKSEMTRSDALEKIGILKLMTTRIMPGFLQCFQDEFVKVRKEICRACCRLKIQDEICVKNLLEIARYDPQWKVKLYAIRALSTIKKPNNEIRSCFLWALQFESVSRLRLEALVAISSRDSLDKEIVDIIKSRFLVEEDEDILRILNRILTEIHINPQNDIDTVNEIKTEIRKFLSDKNHIVDMILYNEAVEEHKRIKNTMIPKIENKNQNKDFEYSEKGDSSNIRISDVDPSYIGEIEIIERVNSFKSLNEITTTAVEEKSSDVKEVDDFDIKIIDENNQTEICLEHVYEDLVKDDLDQDIFIPKEITQLDDIDMNPEVDVVQNIEDIDIIDSDTNNMNSILQDNEIENREAKKVKFSTEMDEIIETKSNDENVDKYENIPCVNQSFEILNEAEGEEYEEEANQVIVKDKEDQDKEQKGDIIFRDDETCINSDDKVNNEETSTIEDVIQGSEILIVESNTDFIISQTERESVKDEKSAEIMISDENESFIEVVEKNGDEKDIAINNSDHNSETLTEDKDGEIREEVNIITEISQEYQIPSTDTNKTDDEQMIQIKTVAQHNKKLIEDKSQSVLPIITCSYKLPSDHSPLSTIHSHSIPISDISSENSAEYDLNMELLQAVNREFLEDVDKVISDNEGLDFGPLEPLL